MSFFKKKRFAFILVLALISTTSAIYGGEAEGFPDVAKTDWCYQDVMDMAKAGVIKGCPDGKFHPIDPLTYGEFIKMTVISYTGTDPGIAEEEYHWASKYYDVALEKELINEVDIPKRVLSNPIPRKHMAILVANSMPGKVIFDYEVIKNSIRDLEQGRQFEHEIIKSYGLGIIAGYTDGSFKPNDYLLRSEAAAVAARLTNETRRIYPNIDVMKEVQEKAEKAVNRPKDIIGLSETSESTLPIEEIAANIRTFQNGFYFGDGKIKYYEIMKNYPYEMKMGYNLIGQERIEMEYEMYRSAVLIKDKSILAMCEGGETDSGMGIYYTVDRMGNSPDKLPDFDYIGFYAIGDTMILVPNPFK